MANTVELIQKLIELALHNPSEEEARSAAMHACRLIDRDKIPVGDMVINVDPSRVWVPPDPDFMQTVADIFEKGGVQPDESPIPESQAGTGGLSIQSRELEDQVTAFRNQVVRAWRAIRETRVKLQGEIYRYERETMRKFSGRGW